MRLGLIDRLRRLARWRVTGGRHRMDVAVRGGTRAAGSRGPEAPYDVPGQRERAPFQPPAGVPQRQLLPQPPAAPQEQVLPWDRPALPVGSTARAIGGGGGGGRARIREAPHDLEADARYGSAPVESATVARREPWYQVVTEATPARRAAGRVAARTQAPPVQRAAARPAPPAPSARLPFVAAHPAGRPDIADGRVHCGPLERVLHRQWTEGAALPVQVVTAVTRLAQLPRHLQQKLADGLTGIFVGPGGVPELDHMGALKGVPLPSGRATWDACAGAYGERKLVVGSRLSPTPDVMCHEVGHALDDLDAPTGRWQSDSPEFKAVYAECKPHLVSDFHRQRGDLGRKEFFADAFAAIASGQRPALVDMLGGDTRTALWVMLYFNRRYGI
jgi:hypothetical protein